MNKIFIFDADEVVLKREMYFSQRLAKDFGIPEEEIMKFFKKEFRDCVVGKSDLRKELEKYIKTWGWKGTVDDLMEYWFENEKEINEDILNEIKNLRGKGYICCLATNNEKYRTQYLLSEVGLGAFFDYVFSSSEIGFLKSQDGFWRYVREKLNENNLGNIVFWESNEEVVEAASGLGIKGIHYKNFDNFKKVMNGMAEQKEAGKEGRKLV